MAIKILNLLTVSSLAVLLASFTALPTPANAVALSGTRQLAARHHGGIARRKSTKTCKPKPTSIAPKVAATPAAKPPPNPKPASQPKANNGSSNNSGSHNPSGGSSNGGNTNNNSPASVSVGGPGKIGMAWQMGNSNALFNFSPANAIYTWSPDCPSLAKNAGIDCYPMNWGWKDVDHFKQVSATSDAEFFLGPNETNEVGQSNLSPDDAVTLWRETMLPLQNRGKKVICPSTSSRPNGLPWTQEFLQKCGDDCKCHAIPLHFYDNTVQKFKDYVNLWHKTFPSYTLWITEFACVNFNGPDQPSESEVTEFMREVTSWLDSLPFVEKYFAFGFAPHPGGGTSDNISLMGGNNKPNALGNIYLHH